MPDITLLTVASAILQPPGSLLILCFLGLVLDWAGFRLTGRALVALALVLLYFLSTASGTWLIVRPLESRYPPYPGSTAPEPDPGAIVVLGGGEIFGVPGQDRGMANARTLMRLQAAAALARQTELPVVPSGGAPRLGMPPEADTMARLLRTTFGITTPIWTEGHSYNTAANARDSARLLARHRIHSIYLVTSALHMPRAMDWFQHYGVRAVPVPCDYRIGRKKPGGWTSWLPRAVFLEISSEAIHEYAGILWFRIRPHMRGDG